MAYKCRICGSNDVANPGDICELCAIGQDPYASAMQNNDGFSPQQQDTYQHGDSGYAPGRGKNRKILLGGGAALNNTDLYGNTIVPQEEEPVQVYSAGQAPTTQSSGTVITGASASQTSSGTNSNTAKANAGPLTSGITKNISVDTEKRSALTKICRSLFKGIPFSLDDEITMFQVFPDYTGTALNAMGNACDQVIVYGKVNAGSVAENNEVEVYGHRDADNNIVAKKIVNKASGTTVTPDRIIPAGVVWGITIAAFVIIFMMVSTGSIEGIVWGVILILCLTNLPLTLKIVMGIFGFIFSLIFRRN